jgi:hypothetical protein
VARNNLDWLKELGNGTKLVRPRFGVVIHRTPTSAANVQDGKEESINKIMEENDLTTKGFLVEDIAWLKSREKLLSRSASLRIWFSTKEAAQWAIDNGLVFGQRYISSVEAYQVKKKRCHKCQQLSHFARDCKKPTRCRHCAGDHERRDCPLGSALKCLDCEGQHPTGHKECKGSAPAPYPQ